MAKGPKAVPNFIWGLLSFAFDKSQSAVFEGKAKLAISRSSIITSKGREAAFLGIPPTQLVDRSYPAYIAAE